jgi:DHA3 family macrolide efflux protein-like MFS transporter
MQTTVALHNNRNFALLWVASFLANIALSISMVTETWYVMRAIGAQDQLGLVMLAGSVPRIAFMALGGVFADRMSRKWLINWSLGLRVVLLVAVLALLHFGLLDIVAMTLFAFAYGVLDAFFWPARDAFTTELVPPVQLPQANAVSLAGNQAGMVLGPAIGGALLTWTSYDWIFTSIASMLTVALACNQAIKSPPRPAIPRPPSQLLADLKEGARYAFANPVLAAILWIYTPANLLFVGPLMVGIPIIVASQFQGEASTLAAMQSAFAAGMVLASIVLSFFPPVRKRLLLITAAIALEGLLLAVIPFAPGVVAACMLQLLIGAGVATNNVPMISLIQQYTDREILGRILSLNSTISMGLAPMSIALVTAAIGSGIGIDTMMILSGISLTALMLVFALQLRAVRETQ